jgi:prepilin-type N-terminal cleavage/methylation domain-containing protein
MDTLCEEIATMRKHAGFTLIELLVVILILAILMAIALPLYLRAVRDSGRQTCRSNMQTIANALQAYKVRNPSHTYPGETPGTAATGVVLSGTFTPAFIGTGLDLEKLPQCPTDSVADDDDDYTVDYTADGQVTINCASDNATEQAFHGTFRPGVDAT